MIHRVLALSRLAARGASFAPAAWIWLALVLATLPVFDWLGVFSIGRSSALRNELFLSTLFAAPAIFLVLAAVRLDTADSRALRLPLFARLPSSDEFVLGRYLGLLVASLPPLLILAAAIASPQILATETPVSSPLSVQVLLLAFFHLALFAAAIVLLSCLTQGAAFPAAALALYTSGTLLPVLAASGTIGPSRPPLWLYLLPNFALFQPTLRASIGAPSAQIGTAFLYAFMAGATLLGIAAWMEGRIVRSGSSPRA
jgi:hypothetical protein